MSHSYREGGVGGHRMEKRGGTTRDDGFHWCGVGGGGGVGEGVTEKKKKYLSEPQS